MAHDKLAIISSTARDLPDHRNKVRDACLEMQFTPHMMEYLPASDSDAIEASLRLVDEAAVYIGIFAHRYGYVPDGHAISVTEMEYNRAVERGIPRLLFFMDKGHPVLADDVETGAGAEKLRALKERLGKERVAGFFKNPDDLRAGVLKSLAALRATPSPTTANGSPHPQYRDERMRAAGERAEELRRRRRELLLRGAPDAELVALQTEYLDLKRILRDGPLLREGDCLSDRYFLIEKLGSGGFATVWKAFDEEDRRLVAVKVLHGQFADSAERRDRFSRGARAMQGLAHPHIVRILEPYREDGGHHYFVMEFVPGGTFMRAVEDGKMSARQVGRVILQVGAALEHAHGRGVIHRDVTPDNILLGQDGSALLTDFDLVRLPDSTGGTRTGSLGKYVYAAPESLVSAQHADPRCDVYSLGMTAIFGYYGQWLPPAAHSKRTGILKQLQISRRLKAALAQATRHDPEARHRSVKEFCADLRAAVRKRSQPPQPEPPKIPAGEILINKLGMRFAWVPPGDSWLGGRDGKPGTTKFTLPQSLWCGVYPVTQAEWEAVLGENPSHFKGNPRCPVESVSWNVVQQFIERLNQRLREDGRVYRLPTEQEWEYICRGGPLFRDQSKYLFYFARSIDDLTPAPTNDLCSTQANFDGNYPAGNADKGPYLQRTSEVGLYLPNPLGIYDLHGNVWEWTSSQRGSYRVIRGGGWRDHGVNCAASDRDWDGPDDSDLILGFRLLAVPSGEK